MILTCSWDWSSREGPKYRSLSSSINCCTTQIWYYYTSSAERGWRLNMAKPNRYSSTPYQNTTHLWQNQTDTGIVFNLHLNGRLCTQRWLQYISHSLCCLSCSAEGWCIDAYTIWWDAQSLQLLCTQQDMHNTHDNFIIRYAQDIDKTHHGFHLLKITVQQIDTRQKSQKKIG
jgi:hypothetical protein